MKTILNVGRATPFINVSFSGLLWGYKDELPCNNLPRPDECGVAKGQLDLFDQEDSEEEAVPMYWSYVHRRVRRRDGWC